MDSCIALCYYYILTKKNSVYNFFLKGKDGNPFTRSTRQIKSLRTHDMKEHNKSGHH